MKLKIKLLLIMILIYIYIYIYIYIATQEFELKSESFPPKLTQTNLASKNDIAANFIKKSWW